MSDCTRSRGCLCFVCRSGRCGSTKVHSYTSGWWSTTIQIKYSDSLDVHRWFLWTHLCRGSPSKNCTSKSYLIINYPILVDSFVLQLTCSLQDEPQRATRARLALTFSGVLRSGRSSGAYGLLSGARCCHADPGISPIEV